MLPLQFTLPTEQIIEVTDSVPSAVQGLEELKSMSFNELIEKVSTSLVTFAINLTIAVVVFYVGKFVIRKIHNVLRTIMLKRKVDASLATFVLSLVKMVLYFILVVTVIGILGIETTSFIALFASAGVAIGMALSGTLQNFAGGVLILLIKPYKVGDFIEFQGYTGTVTEIQIFHTIISTPDNKSIIVPNGGLSTGSINNYSREEYRRVEWTVAISYGDDVDVARKVILDIIADDDRIVKDTIRDDKEKREHQAELAAMAANSEEPAKHHSLISRLVQKRRDRMMKKIETWEKDDMDNVAKFRPQLNTKPVVWVSALADSSVNLSARAWTRNDFYWSVYFETNEKIYKTLPQNNIHFPFPQMDVHLKQENNT